MFTANFLIALREGVEASLLVGILVAYVVKINRRDVLAPMWVGVFFAALLPLLAGAFMTWGPYTLTFEAQEIIGGSLSLLAAVFVTWMMLWMAKNSRHLGKEITAQAQAALAKESARKSAWAFVWLAVLSVGREGIETAVMVMATVKSSASSQAYLPLYGVLAGFICAAVIGYLMYRGSRFFHLRTFFIVTGVFLLFVAAGITSYGIGDLQEAGVIPGWGNAAWDLSPYFDKGGFLSSTSWWFVLLEAMFNFTLAPTHAQVIAWCAYMILVVPFFVKVQILGTKPQKRSEVHTSAPALSSIPSLA